MKKFIIITMLLCCLLGLVGCKNKQGDISNYQTKEVSSSMYSTTDIKSAIDVATRYFQKEFNGCTLKEIYYAGDDKSKGYEDLAQRNNAQEAIVLLSKFTTDKNGGDGSLNSNNTYDNWMWILVRNKGEKWVHVDHGY